MSLYRAGHAKRIVAMQGIIDTEVHASDSWTLEARAAMLGLKVEDLERCMQENPDNTWLEFCEPARLFALQQASQLLALNIPNMLPLVQHTPELLDLPSRSLEDNIRGLQVLLHLTRPQLQQLLLNQPGLLLQGPRAVELQVQRICRGLDLPFEGPDSIRLVHLLPHLGPTALADAAQVVQQVQAVSRALALSSSEVLTVLQAEHLFADAAADLLSADALQSLAAGWRAFCDEVGLPKRDVLAALTAQLPKPDARYTIWSINQLRSDLADLAASCLLERQAVLGMLLSAPRLVSVPDSFWRLLLQYVLFLVPQWRQQLDRMSAAEAGCLLAQLFDDFEASDDVVSLSSRDGLFMSADVDYNHELEVLEALLDHGIKAPMFQGPEAIRAGKLWRLVYLCNPRINASQQHARAVAAAASATNADGSESPSTKPWSWVLDWHIPLPLFDQLQRRGALQCELGGSPQQQQKKNSSSSSGAAAELVESLWEVAAEDCAEFCARHPGYAHWLHNTAFELEWSSSKAARPTPTWDV